MAIPIPQRNWAESAKKSPQRRAHWDIWWFYTHICAAYHWHRVCDSLFSEPRLSLVCHACFNTLLSRPSRGGDWENGTKLNILVSTSRATNFTQTPKKNKNEVWNCHLAMLGRVAKPIFTSLCRGQPSRVWVCWVQKVELPESHWLLADRV